MSFAWVFAYGSNMNIHRMCERFRANGFDSTVISEPCAASLPDYQLIWNYYSASTWKAGAANIERVQGVLLPGVAFKTTSLTGIDKQEGHPKVYKRQLLPLILANGSSVKGWVYIACPQKCRKPPVWPTQEYFDIMLSGCKMFCLPPAHIAAIQEWKRQAAIASAPPNKT